MNTEKLQWKVECKTSFKTWTSCLLTRVIAIQSAVGLAELGHNKTVRVLLIQNAGETT